MNNPFYYTPSARCEQAVSVILTHIQNHPEWHEEVRGGKTFGVLITESETLFAYSGQMLGVMTLKDLYHLSSIILTKKDISRYTKRK